jgi:ribosomal protein S12 methylthiotransferase accessory factor
MISSSWRSTDSFTVLRLIKKNFSRFGLSRIANITSLDVTDIPVYICIRPRGLSFSVSAGKGLTHIEAMVSAAMESIEMDVAESLSQDYAVKKTYNELPLNERIPFDLLPVITGSFFSHSTNASWVRAKKIFSDKHCYVPFDLLTMNTLAVTGLLTSFAWGSNGLASSINKDEAILSGLYEVIERDSLSCWSRYIQKNPSVKLFAINQSTIPYDSTKSLITKIRKAGLDIHLILLRNELNLPVFKCHILNNVDQAKSTASGYGCHHNPEVALNRAITEAAQGRACFISGSREDILSTRFSTTDYAYANSYFSNFILEDLPDFNNSISSTQDALNSIVNQFDTMGWLRPVIYEYHNTAPFSVVKVICPSLMPVSFSGMTLSHPRLNSFNPPRTKFQLFCESL